ncbi:hypothetical protein HDU92_007721, partial [Lobulomyces angularis]
MSFDGMTRTDGISICVLLSKIKTTSYGTSTTSCKRKRTKGEYFQDNIRDVKSNFVVIDPNKRDLLYCLGSNGKKLRYTQMERRKETRSKRYSEIRSEVGIKQNQMNVIVPRKVIDKDAWNIYIKEFFSTWNEKEQVDKNTIFRKLKLNSYYNTQKSEGLFINKFKSIFPDNPTVIIGDWSRSTMKYHVPTKSK